MKEITIKIKSVYGNDVIYPVCSDARLFAELAGTKTLTKQAIYVIKNLGYTVTVEAPTYEL
jgi:hypothetical protein